jgi:hypothetical protein
MTVILVYCKYVSRFSPEISSTYRINSDAAATTFGATSSNNSEKNGRHSGNMIRYSSPTCIEITVPLKSKVKKHSTKDSVYLSEQLVEGLHCHPPNRALLISRHHQEGMVHRLPERVPSYRCGQGSQAAYSVVAAELLVAGVVLEPGPRGDKGDHVENEGVEALLNTQTRGRKEGRSYSKQSGMGKADQTSLMKPLLSNRQQLLMDLRSLADRVTSSAIT